MTGLLYAVESTGTVTRLPCRPIATADHAGDTWWHCSCRPGIRVADPARVLHAGESATDKLAAEAGKGK